MKYWIIIDSVQKGPLSVEELYAIPGLSMSTPVWHEGLADWTTAATIPEIAAIIASRQNGFSNQQPYGQNYGAAPQQPYGNPYGNQYSQPYGGAYRQPAYGQPQYGQEPFDPERMPPMPDNYLVWAIIATICCCIPAGIPAIIYASKVSPAYMRGDYNGALDASSKAQMWIIVAFVAGLIWAPFSMLLGLL